MKTLWSKLLLTLTMLLLVACGGQAESEIAYDSASDSTVAYVAQADYASDAVSADFENRSASRSELNIGRGQLGQVQRLIIKSGNMSIEVEDIDIAVNDATAFALGLGGYVVSQEVSGYDRYRNGTLTLGVPVANFESAMAAFREYGTVNSESASGQDVTEEYVDLNSRLDNLQATQTRLRELYDAAQNVKDTLEIDRELRQIEGEINVVQGRVKYLAERAAVSTITLNLSATSDEPIGQPSRWTVINTINTATDDLIIGVQQLADGAVYFAIAVLPFLLILGFIGFLVWRIVRRLFRGAQANTNTSPPSPPASTVPAGD